MNATGALMVALVLRVLGTPWPFSASLVASLEGNARRLLEP